MEERVMGGGALPATGRGLWLLCPCHWLSQCHTMLPVLCP